jgi:hypothetical protein
MKARLGRLSGDMYSRENTGKIRSAVGNNLAPGIKDTHPGGRMRSTLQNFAYCCKNYQD